MQYADTRAPGWSTPSPRSSGGHFACEDTMSTKTEHSPCQRRSLRRPSVRRCYEVRTRGSSRRQLGGVFLGKLRAPTRGMVPRGAVELRSDSMVGPYRLVKEIGRGGMGTVYEAVHAMLPRRAAIKIMHGDLRRQPGMAKRMVQEASILEEIRHPGVVRVYDCNLFDDHRPWIAMELVEGETLAARLHRLS